MIVTIDSIPVYNAILSDEETGMLKISLVDEPAVMSNFVAFAKEKPVVLFKAVDEEKRLCCGCVMRADFPIYRFSPAMGEYYIIYKADTIRQMAEKYLLENRQNNVNLMHEEGSDVEGVQMVQYYIKDVAKGINPAGFEDIADGSLFAEFHVVNDEVWQSIKEGTYKGFSLEGIFDLEPEQDSKGVEQIVSTLEGRFSAILNNKNMSKMERIRAALAKALAEFGNITTDKGVLAWDGDEDIKVGDTAYIEDQEGNRTPAEDGEYTTTDNKVIVVAEGKVAEIKDAEAEVDPTPEETPEVAEQETEVSAEENEVKAKRQSFFSKVKQAFEDSYEEKERKIMEAIAATLSDGEYAYIAEAGDSYAIINLYTEENWEGKYIKYEISFDESGNVVLGASEEVELAFVPVNDPNPADNAPSEEEFNAIKAENESLKAEVEALKSQSMAKAAHEEVVETSTKTVKTGYKGLDRLQRITSAK